MGDPLFHLHLEGMLILIWTVYKSKGCWPFFSITAWCRGKEVVALLYALPTSRTAVQKHKFTLLNLNVISQSCSEEGFVPPCVMHRHMHTSERRKAIIKKEVKMLLSVPGAQMFARSFIKWKSGRVNMREHIIAQQTNVCFSIDSPWVLCLSQAAVWPSVNVTLKPS